MIEVLLIRYLLPYGTVSLFLVALTPEWIFSVARI